MKNNFAFLFLTVFLFTGLCLSRAQEFNEIEKTFKIDSGGKVVIDTYKGSVIIDTWDKNEVSVYAKMVPDDEGFWSTNPQKQLSHVNVEFNETPSSIKIESKYKKSNSWFGNNTRAFVHYKIHMSKNAQLVFKDYKSDIEISGIQSSIKLDTYKGEVKVNNLTGGIDLETYKGDVIVKFDKLTERSRFETYKGEIVVSLPHTSKFTIDADLGRRADFYTNFNFGGNSKNKSKKSYDIRDDVNGGGAVIRLISNKGRIELNGN